jgi:5-formyltetrahydrofolate cyclo-ligase
MNSKELVRSEILRKRRGLSPDEISHLSHQVCENLFSSSLWPAKGKVALYSPIKNEVETRTIFERAIQDGLEVYYPRIAGDEIQFHRVNDLKELKPGSFGVLESLKTSEKLSENEKLDLLIVPGVAFDQKGHRLGYGKGFYDRFLAKKRFEKSVGLAYQLQIKESLPHEDHDEKVDEVITENGLI